MSGRAALPAKTPARPAPPLGEAMSALLRRNVRAVVFVFVRLVAVALLSTLLERQIPSVRRNRLLVDAIGSVLVIWPFYTAIGRNAAWRIALGRAYVREGRWAEAERALLPFLRRGYQPFDAGGEGAYWLAVALRALGREKDALRLFQSVTRTRRGPWREKAEAALANPAPDPVPAP